MPAQISTPLTTGLSVRLASRKTILNSPTPGLAPGYLQANLVVLPKRHASDFRLLCARNPVPCPLLAESESPGDPHGLISRLPGVPSHDLAHDFDVRHDVPRYRLYKEGKLVTEMQNIEDYWAPDHVAFLIGCSFSFESALEAAGLFVRHTIQGRNVPMYRTNIPLCPAGIFAGGTYVVTMRPYRASDIPLVRQVTAPYTATHGEPIAWGWEAVKRLGIKDIRCPEWGDKPINLDGSDFHDDGEFVPVFWGCGVTVQEAVIQAEIQGVIIVHAPGYMIVLDTLDGDILTPAEAMEEENLGKHGGAQYDRD